MTVQAIGEQARGHQAGPARLYDGTVAAHYYRAMGEVEERLELGESVRDPSANGGQLLALADAPSAGTLISGP